MTYLRFVLQWPFAVQPYCEFGCSIRETIDSPSTLGVMESVLNSGLTTGTASITSSGVETPRGVVPDRFRTTSAPKNEPIVPAEFTSTSASRLVSEPPSRYSSLITP